MLDRFNAIATAQGRQNRLVEAEGGKISDYFEQNVFTEAKMKQYLPKQTFDKLKEGSGRGTLPKLLTSIKNVYKPYPPWSLGPDNLKQNSYHLN